MALNIGRAQDQALAEGFFDQFTGSKDELLDTPLNKVEEVLYLWGGNFISKLKSNLEAADAVSSGELSDSINLRVKAFGGNYVLTVTLADYYDFVNKGVKGIESGSKAPNSPYQFRNKGVSKAFMTALSKWIVREGLKSRIRKEAKVTSDVYRRKAKVIREGVGIRSLAYMIGTGIKKKGLRATNFFDDAIESDYPKLAQELAVAMGKDVQEVFRRLDKKLNNGNDNTNRSGN